MRPLPVVRSCPWIIGLMLLAGCGGGGSGSGGGTGSTGAPALQAAVTPQGSFTAGQANATYTITVKNSGNAANSGTVTVTDPPTGFTIASMSGSGWTCTIGSSADTCTTSNSLGAGQSFPAIAVTGTVTSTTGAVSIPVTVAFNGTSSTSSASVTLAPTVNFSVSPSSITLGSSANLSWSTTNAVSCAPSGAWSGTTATSGTQGVAPTAASLSIPGFLTYTLACQNSANATVSSNAVLTVTYPTPTGPLANVRSFIDTNTGGLYDPVEESDIANSLTDLVVVANSITNPLNRAVVDPTNSKLILGFTAAGEAASWLEPSLFSGSSLPSWFGNQVPGYPGLYSVQYWNPAWEPALFATIDETVANGYDGIWIDGLDSDLAWSSGNPESNPVYADAVSAMATLMTDIRNHLNTTYPGKTFYLIGNNPTNVALANPDALKSLDVIYQENAYYWVFLGFTGNGAATTLASTYAPAYATAGVPIFGNDYPQPLSDSSAALLSFELHSSLGWISSVTDAQLDDSIFTTGPFMFTATPSNSTVRGYPNYVNFLSGGLAPNATLSGGNMGDYFIGGSGQNTITGGSGNDTIYAHPANATSKGALLIDLVSSIPAGASTPSVAVRVNGNEVISATPITAQVGSTESTFQRLQASMPNSISSVQLTVTATQGGSAVYFADIIYNGVFINLGLGTYTNGHPPPFPLSWGTVTFPGTAFDVVPQFPSNTSDVIDGGGGTNTVVYRGPSSNYTVAKQSDGSYLVTSASTAEGPDTLTHIQVLQFSDTQMTLP